MNEPVIIAPVLRAEWREAWEIVKRLGYTGPVLVQCGQGVPNEVHLPGPVTKIVIDKSRPKGR